MPRRNIVFLVIAAASAAVCARLGVWQVHRLAERRAYNALVSTRLDEPPISLAAVPHDTALRHYRRVRLAGTFDFSHEAVLVDRARNGAPGVNLITPMRPDSGILGDTAVLVDRGWVYAADGMSVAGQEWQEPTHFSGTGYLVSLSKAPGPAGLSASGHPNAYRWLDRAEVERQVGRPVADYTIVLEGDTTAPQLASTDAGTAGVSRIPVRLQPPPLDEGPHMNYAIQWFSFAIIIVVGTTYALFVAPKQQKRVGGAV